MDNKTVVLYSTGCPKCKVLKQKLDKVGIAYTVEDSVDKMTAMGIMQVPMLGIGDNLYGFVDAVDWVKHQEVTQ